MFARRDGRLGSTAGLQWNIVFVPGPSRIAIPQRLERAVVGGSFGRRDYSMATTCSRRHQDPAWMTKTQSPDGFEFLRKVSIDPHSMRATTADDIIPSSRRIKLWASVCPKHCDHVTGAVRSHGKARRFARHTRPTPACPRRPRPPEARNVTWRGKILVTTGQRERTGTA